MNPVNPASPVAVQLVDALTAGVTDWCGLLGLDLLPELTARAEAAAGRIAAELTGEDRTAAARTAADLIGILGEPDDAAQWGTPLWAAIGSALGDDPERPGFSRSQAATVLGVKQGTVSQLEHRGTLPRRDDGSISRAAVFARLLGSSGNCTA